MKTRAKANTKTYLVGGNENGNESICENGDIYDTSENENEKTKTTMKNENKREGKSNRKHDHENEHGNETEGKTNGRRRCFLGQTIDRPSVGWSYVGG